VKALAENGMNFDFWNPDCPEKKAFRNADTVEVGFVSYFLGNDEKRAYI
jgi:hypothetical protein